MRLHALTWKAAIVGLGLFLVAIQAVDGRQCAEKAMHFPLNAGGKKERRGGPGSGVTRIVVAEGERPKSIDGQERVVGILQESDELVGETIERRNPPAAEVPH